MNFISLPVCGSAGNASLRWVIAGRAITYGGVSRRFNMCGLVPTGAMVSERLARVNTKMTRIEA